MLQGKDYQMRLVDCNATHHSLQVSNCDADGEMDTAVDVRVEEFRTVVVP